MPNITPRKNKNGEITSYTIRVYHGYDSNGKRLKPYTMSYKPAQGMTSKQIEKEVQRQALLFEEQCRNGQIGANRNIKLADFCPMYLEIKENILAPRTYEFYKNEINSLIIPLLGHIKLSELRPAHVQQFIQYLQGDIRKKSEEQDNTKLSPSTIKRKLAVLQSILKQAVKLDVIPTNPANTEKLTLPKTVKADIEIFTRQEAAEILSCLENEPLQFQVIVQLALMSGARLGELVALKFSDVDFQDNKITISRSAYKLKGEPIRTKAPKDNDVRTVTINQYCIDLLKLLKSEKSQQAFKLGTAWKGEEWIFTQWDGSIMYPQTPSAQWRDFLKKHGFRHRKFHSLRHTSATLLLYGGVNVKQVQERLGHGDLKTTNLYLHYISEADKEAANVLQNMLTTKKTIEEQDAHIQKII